MANPKTLLIGIGNEFRRDDGAGVYIIREIRKRGYPGIEVVEHQGEGTDLIEHWAGFDRVIVFDAVTSGKVPGTVHHFNLPGDEIPKEMRCCSTHAVSLLGAIELAGALGRLPRQLIIYGIEGLSFEVGPDLSPPVRKAAQTVIQRVGEELGK